MVAIWLKKVIILSQHELPWVLLQGFNFNIASTLRRHWVKFEFQNVDKKILRNNSII